MRYITYDHPIFYALYFRIDEDDCIIKPLIISLAEYQFTRHINKEEELRLQIINLQEELENNFLKGNNLLLDKSYDKNKCIYSNRYIKRKFR